MPRAIAQFSFGSFGDIVTLIEVALILKDCLVDGASVQRDVLEFAQFLDIYVEVLYCIQAVLLSPRARKIQKSSKNAIEHALTTSTRLVEELLIRLQSFNSATWPLLILQAFHWAFCAKAELSNLRKKLLEQGNLMTQILSLSGLEISLDLAQSPCYAWLPSQPQTHSVVLVDILDQVTFVPIELCLNKVVFHKFLQLYFESRAGWSFIRRGDYDVVLRSDNGTSQRPWDVALRAGATINMSAILRSQRIDRRRCPRCHRLNPPPAIDLDGEIKCLHCQTFFRAAQGRIRAIHDVDTSNHLQRCDTPTSYASEDDFQYVRRFLIELPEIPARQPSSDEGGWGMVLQSYLRAKGRLRRT